MGLLVCGVGLVVMGGRGRGVHEHTPQPESAPRLLLFINFFSFFHQGRAKSTNM